MKRVLCGFRYDHTEMTKAYAMGEKEETVCYEHLTKEEWVNCNELKKKYIQF